MLRIAVLICVENWVSAELLGISKKMYYIYKNITKKCIKVFIIQVQVVLFLCYCTVYGPTLLNNNATYLLPWLQPLTAGRVTELFVEFKISAKFVQQHLKLNYPKQNMIQVKLMSQVSYTSLLAVTVQS